MYLIIDTETTGIHGFYNNYIGVNIKQPRLVQLSWQIHDYLGNLIEFENFILKPDNYDIPFNSFKIHGITNNIAEKYGSSLDFVLKKFKKTIEKYNYIIGHNLEFDLKIIKNEFCIRKIKIDLKNKKILDTKLFSVNYCKLPGNRRKFKWPTLSELYFKLFSENIPNKHDAENDVKATARCFLELLRIDIISDKDIEKNLLLFRKKFFHVIPKSIVSFREKKIIYKDLYHKKEQNSLFHSNKWKNFKYSYSHIHNHTHFSILNSTISVKNLIEKAIEFNMPAVGITDYGNMMGSYYFLNNIHFVNKSLPKKKIKGIVGCEFFISDNFLRKKFTKEDPDKRYTQVLLSKNKKGYRNLIKICSIGFTHGFYSGIPRIGKNIIENYKNDLIALTGDLNSEIPYNILNYGEKIAEKTFLWWKNLFKDDFYIELLRHEIDEENYVNDILLKFSKKHKVKFIAQNNVFYLDKSNANAHDILLCIKNNSKQSTPIGKGRGFRFGFPNNEYYFKNVEEMKKIFLDLPESFESLEELISKIEHYNISRKILLPEFNSVEIKNKQYSKDKNTKIENQFLSKLTYEGAKKRYKIITEKINKRISFELKTIEKIGYPGYFLIIQDIISQAKKMEIAVGPGRGSSAGSVVAYCLGITNIDPIKYNLLFERFLNPDRISLPDIDIDFDDKGREKIIEWVSEKYGKKKVAQIITYSTMGAKSSIRDVGRVLDIPLEDINRIAKMIPNNLTLNEILNNNIEKKYSINTNNINIIKRIAFDTNNVLNKVLIQAKILEGTIRSTGVHACGLIISPCNIDDIIPVSISKESSFLITQFDNNIVENAGLLKMDFLGLKTLSIIRSTINILKSRKIIKDILFPLDDKKTYKLFQRGETSAIFQYESLGMQKYLKKLKPDKFDDLIAMNALYRPGPMQYIPNFIDRKHGKEDITYDFPEMKKLLKETYGITVYQEQVMLISQMLAGFSKGEADFLRKAIGKKQRNVLDTMKNQFINRSIQRGYDKNIIKKIWKDWEYFACYAFNKSHATCYAYIAFKTAYLKAHFPCEYMASVLSNNMNNIKQITYLIKECRRMKLFIEKPDINNSEYNFVAVNENCIRFGLTGIKGVGDNAVKKIIQERKKNGLFSSIFNLVDRIDLRVVNKKTLESLILSGAMDSFNIRREQYFYVDKSSNLSFLEKIIRFGSKNKKMEAPVITECDIWNDIDKLSKEKDVLGTYVSSHPLDKFYYEIKYLTNISINKLLEKKILCNDDINNQKQILYYSFVGLLSKVDNRFYKKSNVEYGSFLLEDYNSIKEFKMYGKKYLKYKHLLIKNNLLFVCISIEKIYFKENKITILHIEKLQNVFRNLVHKLIIKINVIDLNESLINNIENVLIKNKGDKTLDIMLYDKISGIYLDFESKNYKINVNYGFLRELEKLNEIDFYFI
ncbi:DNA polymerase III subunit alpha [Blattabacterium cuenoti]|uniref:DNA polymerase III subunit alpha n=1 Tax=Blattabacterium cuenoti TaxID=1653831 RepID=UPI00163C2972|nr:DNA polymerase III subunit alpha [Blattabacterium cuenoti]